jgi:hypothetical protein
MINVLMIGKIKAVRRIELDGFVDSKWTENIPKIEVTVESEIPDDNGDINYSMDKQILESSEYKKFKDLEHKYVAVPYVMDSSAKGQKWYPDKNTPMFELRDSFASMIKSDKKDEVKKA